MSEPLEPITPERVCKVLEGMCLLEFDQTSPVDFATHVYLFTHIARGTCKNPHEDWQQLFRDVEKIVLDTLDSPANKAKRKEAGDELDTRDLTVFFGERRAMHSPQNQTETKTP